MQKKVNSHRVSLLTACISGLIFALTFGLPLYIYCALWFGWIFPTQNYGISTRLFLVVSFFFLAVLVLLCIGFWRVGIFAAKKAGNMNTGMIAGIWMGIVVIGITWLVRSVSTQFGAPMITYPGNPVRGQVLFGSIYFFFPYIVIFAGFLFGLIGGATGADRADLPREEE